ncbi:MAG: hypothetical protein AVDCRST_MAG75-495 [uncultured Propionibacteriaceae bacterium]|uniref:Uncharacterized protein n=1 Tax=uncultured Propionibacteriaceae bacterium TaxID=257457 RepID=A0A6J4N6D6_9ACTN|nr:MAG: hypothetical protein AVDCRST_MAG75-495 [uncultured Propionibacteriaceae bacterium]
MGCLLRIQRPRLRQSTRWMMLGFIQRRIIMEFMPKTGNAHHAATA